MFPAPAPAASPSPLRFTPWGLVGRTFRVWLRNAFAFTVVAVVLQLPVAALQLRAGETENRPALMLTMLFAWVVAQVASATLSLGVLQSLGGSRPNAGTLLATTARQLWPIFAVVGVYSAMVMLGTFALVLPGVFMALAGFVAVPAIVAEPTLGTEAALRRSFHLTEGHRLELLAALVFLIGVELLVVLGIQRLEAGPLASSRAGGIAVRNLADAVLSGFTGCCAAVAYHDLRLQKGLSAPRARAAA